MPGLCRGLHARRYQHHALRGHLLKTGATWRRDGSLIMDFSQECFYLATLEDASWLKETIMTRAKSGALPVPSAATSGDSVEDGRQSDSQPGGYAVEDPTEPRRMKMNLTVAAMGRMITQSTLASVARLRTISGGTHLSDGGVQASARLQLV